MKAETLIREAHRRKIALLPNLDGTLLIRFGVPDPEFVAVLRAHKPAILAWLRSRRHLAKQVLAGEFHGANQRMAQMVIRELRENITDPVCLLALQKMKADALRPTNR